MSWHYVGSGNTDFELVLRHDARFSDGTQVTADAVAKWLTYFAGAHGTFAGNLGPNPSFQAKDAWTVDIHLTAPDANIPISLSEAELWGFVASPKVVADPSLFASGSYGAGPYMLNASATVINDHYVFVPNPHYYDQSAIKYSEVDVKIISTPSSMLQALQAGQLDIAQGDVNTASAANSSGFHVLVAPQSNVVLQIGDAGGTTSKPLADPRVRQAMGYALDRQTIVKGVLQGYGTATSEILTVDASDSAEQNYYPYDPQKARQLLADAGYPNGFTVKCVDFVYGQLGDPIIQAAAQYLGAVGIHLQVKTDQLSEYNADLKSKLYPIYENIFSIRPAAELYRISMAPTASVFGFDDPATDQLYQSALTSTGPGEFKQMMQRITEQDFILTIAAGSVLAYVSNGVKGVQVSSSRGFLYPSEWYPAS